jgi:DNA-binding MarR family transcriptional regulator
MDTNDKVDGPTVCTCGKLRRLTRRVTQIYDGFLEPVGLTITQFAILGPVMRHGGIAMGALAEIMVMDPTTLTRNLRPLMDRGYIKVVRDATDRRRQGIWATEAGKAVAREAAPHWRKAQAHVAAVVGGGEVERLGGLLDLSLARLVQA